MAILSDKEQKKQFKQIASADPDKYYPTAALKRNGFQRKQCEVCKKYFWTVNEDQTKCGDPACNVGFQVVKNNPSKNRLSFIGVWKKIVEILEPRGYKPIKRYPVVARWNPTTEFTIASIAAFQPYVISGEVPPPAKKLLIPQFCLRFGDIENVGVTGSHCTGFVMIGQHMFVPPEEWDQEQAFQDIYDFLIEGVGLDKSEVTIHEDAWAGGGNFGPCMEFFSRGVELFNQVYMMYQQTPEGPKELSLKVLDMGLGQERVAWFSQGTPNIYEAIFPYVLKKIRERVKIELDHDLYSRFSQYSAFLNVDEVDDMDAAWKRVADAMQMDVEELKSKIIPMTGIYSVAEHSRALLFAISDGKLPSNVGGGYNLRVIFRRAIAFIDQFNWDLDMAEVCRWHAEELYEMFPEVSENLDEVARVLEVEKKKYYATKKDAEKIVKKLLKKNAITEEKLIELYDSHGINPEIVRDAAAKMGIKIKIPDDFYGKVIARHEKKAQIHETHKAIDIDVEDLPPTQSLYFDDYSKCENEAKALRIKRITHTIEIEEDPLLATTNKTPNLPKSKEGTMKEIDAWAVIVDKSVAYPTSGGQLHDTGTINGIPFIDVVKVGPCIVHILSQEPNFKEGDTVTIKVDMERRKRLTQHHTATHIINAAARQVLGNHVNQAGAKKTPTKAHLDITHYESLSDEEIEKIENIANEIVQKGIPSNNRFMTRTEAEQKYGMRLYQGGAVPGREIRIVEIPGIDVEACGGTHVNNTKEVGRIKIIKTQKIQDGIVRLTFTAGDATKDLLKRYKQIEDKLAEILETSPQNIEKRAEELLEKWKILRKAKSTGKYAESAFAFEKEQTEEKTTEDQELISEEGLKRLERMAKKFESPIDFLPEKMSKLKKEWEQMKKEIKKIAEVVGDKNIEKLINNAETLKNIEAKFISAYYQGIDNKTLTNVVKKLLKKEKDIIIILLGSSERGINCVIARSPSLDAIDLRKISKEFFAKFGGKGGGKPDSVQGFINNYKYKPTEIIETLKSMIDK